MTGAAPIGRVRVAGTVRGHRPPSVLPGNSPSFIKTDHGRLTVTTQRSPQIAHRLSAHDLPRLLALHSLPPSLAPFLFDQPGLPLLAVQLSPHPFNIPSSPSSPLSPLLSPPLLPPSLFNTSLFSFSLSTVLLSCLSFPPFGHTPCFTPPRPPVAGPYPRIIPPRTVSAPKE